MGDGSHFVFRQKLLGEDGSFHGKAATFVLAKVWGDVFPRFNAVATKRRSIARNSHFACWDKFFVHSPLDVKESYDHALDVVFT